MSDESAKPNQSNAKIRDVAFTIEIAGKHDENVMHPITQQMMRGRWATANHRTMFAEDQEDPQSAINRMPDLPGMRIEVNAQKKLARIYDPLGEAEFRDTKEQAAKIAKTALNRNFGPEKEVRYANLSDEILKSWIYWARRFLDARQCDIISGRVPEMKEILAMDGKIIKGNFDSDLPDDQRYRPMAHEEVATR